MVSTGGIQRTRGLITQSERPVTVAEVMADIEQRVANGDVGRFRPLSTGFHPLDDVLAGGLRPGELMIVGGAFGVGKTIFALQTARNVALNCVASIKEAIGDS